MSVPENIKKLKPTQFGSVEIRNFNGRYYVYQVSSKWNPEKGRPQKITGKSIGKITEADGFIANAYCMQLLKKKANGDRETADSDGNFAPIVKNYGTYKVLQDLSPEISPRLKEQFPDVFREIRTISLIRLADSITSAKMIQPMFLDSYLSDICDDISVSEVSVRKFITQLGSMQGRCESFMRSYVMPGTTLLFDGTTIFTGSSDSLATKGYNPEHRRKTQARLLYVFEKDSFKPVFYRVLQGSIVDKTAFLEVVRASGCKDSIIVADKGFYSKKNLSSLLEADMKYILPLQDNTTNVEKEFYENPDDNKWDGVFSYKSRAIWFRKRKSGNRGNYIYTFRDDIRKAEMVSNYVEAAEKDYGEEEHQPMNVIRETRMGYFSYCSNLDIQAKDVYLDYKERWNIEQCFDYLKNSVSHSASYAHNDNYFRGWAFINHVSLLYYYGLINALRNANLSDSYSPADVIKLTKNIYKVDTGDGKGYKLSAIQKPTMKLLDDLKVSLSR